MDIRFLFLSLSLFLNISVLQLIHPTRTYINTCRSSKWLRRIYTQLNKIIRSIQIQFKFNRLNGHELTLIILSVLCTTITKNIYTLPCYTKLNYTKTFLYILLSFHFPSLRFAKNTFLSIKNQESKEIKTIPIILFLCTKLIHKDTLNKLWFPSLSIIWVQ